MEPEEWTKVELPKLIGRMDPRTDEAGEPLPEREIVCPGWLVHHPEVNEGAHAYAVRKDGALRDYYPTLPNHVLEAADVAAVAFNEWERTQLPDVK